MREHCERTKRPFFIVALKGYGERACQGLAADQYHIGRLGNVGAFVRAGKKAGVQDVVLAGSFSSPSLSSLWPDFAMLKILLQLGFRLGADDTALKAVANSIDSYGFKLVGVHQIMQDLLAVRGVYSAQKPKQGDWQDIARGYKVAKALGELDVGQGCIVQGGYVLGVETVEGTDALIARAGQQARYQQKGCLIKTMKPQQDQRMDMPTVGPETLKALHRAGFKGLAVEAGASLILHYDECCALANKLGLFFLGFSAEDLEA